MGFWHRYGIGARRAAPLAVAVAVFGVSYGVLARQAGMGPIAPLVMSATTFAGSAQFAVVSVLTAGGGVAAACVAAILLNVRYAPIGVSTQAALEGGPLKRIAEAQLVVDESWALSNQGGGRFDRRVLIGAGALLYLAWLSGSAIGVSFGSLIGDPETLGLDAAFPALFLALLLGQIRSRTAALAAVLGGAISITVIPFVKPGLPLITACVACLIGWGRQPHARGDVTRAEVATEESR
jgi:4-azaleucine resistance transporter AzlC